MIFFFKVFYLKNYIFFSRHYYNQFLSFIFLSLDISFHNISCILLIVREYSDNRFHSQTIFSDISNIAKFIFIIVLFVCSLN